MCQAKRAQLYSNPGGPIPEAGHGFGRAIALMLARDGADIAVADTGRSRASQRYSAVADTDQLSGTVQEVEALGRKAIGTLRVTEVRKSDDRRRVAETTREALDHIDILCANAGTFSDEMLPAWELAEAEWDVIMEVNLKPTQMVDKSKPPCSTSCPHWDRVVGHPNATYAAFGAESGRENLFGRRGQLDFAEVAQAVLWLAIDHFRPVTG